MHLTKISALDLAPSNVRVNSVSPARRVRGSVANAFGSVEIIEMSAVGRMRMQTRYVG